MAESPQYHPINCGLYDYLEMWAVKQMPIQLIYKVEGKLQMLDNAIIQDLQTKNKEEFISLHSGEVIRLDQIIKINDVDFQIESC
ncbi:MAG: hypothetical protein KDD32_06565 [Bacteroidetes bacterium]|nr:hypothetical protein [Bacteroidota bacterium]